MFQNPDSWLVIVSLAVTVVAVLLWLKEAGDDWLTNDSDGRWARAQLTDFADTHDVQRT